MNKEISVFFDKRLIQFIHGCESSGISKGTTIHRKPEWADIIAFLRSTDERLTYISDHPKRFFRIFLTFFELLEAAGGLVVNGKGQWLFIFRNGRWDLPKGVLEKNEFPQEAAIREVREECGISAIHVISGLPATYHIYSGQNDKWILKKTSWFLMRHHKDETPVPQHSEGIETAKWHSPDNLQDIKKNTYGNILGLLNFCLKTAQ